MFYRQVLFGRNYYTEKLLYLALVWAKGQTSPLLHPAVAQADSVNELGAKNEFQTYVFAHTYTRQLKRMSYLKYIILDQIFQGGKPPPLHPRRVKSQPPPPLGFAAGVITQVRLAVNASSMKSNRL